MCTPIVTDDCIYGVGSYGEMRCLDTKTGKIVWETHDATGHGRWWNAFLVPHGRPRRHLQRAGRPDLRQALPRGLQGTQPRENDRAHAADRRRMTVWSHPAFAMQSVFARNDGELIRVNLAGNP